MRFRLSSPTGADPQQRSKISRRVTTRPALRESSTSNCMTSGSVTKLPLLLSIALAAGRTRIGPILKSWM
ncbi:MAG: hypothetical protein ACTHOI_07585 [Sphingomicrobium sp.]